MAKPWMSGPAEILRHGLGHLERDSDTDRRLAMISIDNAVELIIKTYLNQPRRASTSPGLSRKDRDSIGETFPDQLDALEKHAPGRLVGIDLAEIEWFHGLRNQLYHQGNGLTVERDKVVNYAMIATLLFRTLFEEELGVDFGAVNTSPELLATAQFLEQWWLLEERLADLAGQEEGGPFVFGSALSELQKSGLLTRAQVGDLRELRALRNAVIRGGKDMDFDAQDIGRVRNLIASLGASASAG